MSVSVSLNASRGGSLLGQDSLRKRVAGSLAGGVTGAAALVIVAIVVTIVVSIVIGGWSTLSWEFLTQAPREGMMEGGIFPAIVGTVLMTLLMSVMAVPLGTITAIYLSEFASPTSIFARAIRFAVNTLASIPSIVFGLFGLGFFVQFIGKGIDSVANPGTLVWGQPNILWASMTMGLLTMPVVIVSVEEAIRTVPRDWRDASLALGATRMQTIRKIVIPSSLSGILTGMILAISRGAGEVAPILFTGAAFFLPEVPHALSQQFMHLGYHIYVLATQSANVDKTIPLQYATTLVLLGLTFSLNIIAVVLRSRIRSNAQHG
ncbi:MAG: phosphate ABC transporter permease PstA [Bacteroidetes bacterium]|nr:phosphate ABC transporter permease PstA [Bacteroidota bacterium]